MVRVRCGVEKFVFIAMVNKRDSSAQHRDQVNKADIAQNVVS